MHLNIIFGYVDPGTGSYCFQLVIAAVTAGCYTLSRFKTKIASLFKGREKNPPQTGKQEQVL